MKGHAFIAFALAFTVFHVNGLYTHKCKEAETSSNQLMRIIENTNCTLIEGGKKLHETVNHLKFTFKLGIDHFKNKFARPTTKRPGYEGLDDAIDVRILPGDDEQPVTVRSKRETTEEEIEPSNPEAVDVAETTAEGETAQQTIQKADPFGILFAPSKCPKGYQKVGSTCRRTYD